MTLQHHLKFTGIVDVPEDKRVSGYLRNLYLESSGNLVTIKYHSPGGKRHTKETWWFDAVYQTYSDGSTNPLLPNPTGMFTWNRTQIAMKVELTLGQRRNDSANFGTMLDWPTLLSEKAQINTFMPRQMAAILQTTFPNAFSSMKILVLWLKFPQNFVHEGRIDNKSALIQVMAGDKPLSGPIMTHFIISATRPQGINTIWNTF